MHHPPLLPLTIAVICLVGVLGCADTDYKSHADTTTTCAEMDSAQCATVAGCEVATAQGGDSTCLHAEDKACWEDPDCILTSGEFQLGGVDTYCPSGGQQPSLVEVTLLPDEGNDSCSPSVGISGFIEFGFPLTQPLDVGATFEYQEWKNQPGSYGSFCGYRDGWGECANISSSSMHIVQQDDQGRYIAEYEFRVRSDEAVFQGVAALESCGVTACAQP